MIMNKKTRALTEEQYRKIITTINLYLRDYVQNMILTYCQS